MVAADDVRPLSEFQRNSREYIRRLTRTGLPEVLTVNGKAAVVVQDASAYQKMINELEEARTAAAIESVRQGETGLPVKEAFALIRARVKARRK